MDTSDEHINAWLEDLEPDEPLAVAQAPYDAPRRWHPLVLVLGVVVAVLAVGIGVMNAMGGGQVNESALAVVPSGETSPATPDPAMAAPPEGGAGEQGPPAQPPAATPAPDGASALGIANTESPALPGEEDPYDQTGPGEASLTQHLVRAGNQWTTHAGAEEAVRAALTTDQTAPGRGVGTAHVHAVQSLPFANIGRIVQVRAWVGEGIGSLWAVPVKDDGTVLAQPWLVSSEQRPLIDAVPDPSGTVDKDEAVAVLTKAGWTNVEVAASGVHPSIPDILIVRATGVPPHGKQPVTNVVWLGGPAGSRHLMGV